MTQLLVENCQIWHHIQKYVDKCIKYGTTYQNYFNRPQRRYDVNVIAQIQENTSSLHYKQKLVKQTPVQQNILPLHSQNTVTHIALEVCNNKHSQTQTIASPHTSLHWKQRTHKYMICCHITHNNRTLVILIRDFIQELYVLPDDDMPCAIKTCRSSESALA